VKIGSGLLDKLLEAFEPANVFVLLLVFNVRSDELSQGFLILNSFLQEVVKTFLEILQKRN